MEWPAHLPIVGGGGVTLPMCIYQENISQFDNYSSICG